MPQMSPMYWLILMMFFISILMFFIYMNYYMYTVKTYSNKNSNSLMIKTFKWKW